MVPVNPTTMSTPARQQDGHSERGILSFAALFQRRTASRQRSISGDLLSGIFVRCRCSVIILHSSRDPAIRDSRGAANRKSSTLRVHQKKCASLGAGPWCRAAAVSMDVLRDSIMESNGVTPTPAPTAATTGYVVPASNGAEMGPSRQIRTGRVGGRGSTPRPTLGASSPTTSTSLVVKSPTASIMNDTVSFRLQEQIVKSCHSCEISGTHMRAYIPALLLRHRQPDGLRKSRRIKEPLELPPGPSRTMTPTSSACPIRRFQRNKTSNQ
mmetsp:Transcript_18116/g.43507  ORF Transcript_18116/g.43507 Transcript_18116/m.43507 type:complete len:269 (+) Transcript_18116:503-1309(+)